MFIALASVAAAREMGMRGAGAVSCSEYAEHYRANRQYAELFFGSWAQGFMSGFNAGALLSKSYPPRDLGAATSDDMFFWTGQYCEAHPLAVYEQAVFAFLSRMPAVAKPK
jgi:hypothetical protein